MVILVKSVGFKRKDYECERRGWGKRRDEANTEWRGKIEENEL
jgi:hypothetical protein